MYDIVSSAVDILFYVCAAAAIITALVKIAKNKKDKSSQDGNK